LPPLNALKAFEAAARHESFTRAAEELFVTQGAVSHPVKALEEELGVSAGETTDDGAFTLETDASVGAGAIAPAVRIDTLVYGPLNVDEARHLIYARRAEKTRARKVGAEANA